MARVQLEGIAKRYPDGTDAVRELSLTVPDGELLVIMGPSGCGKSTLLRLIAGLEEPTAGRVRLDDTDVTLTPPAERDVAMVFQAYALYPHMTVGENLAFPLKMRRVATGERQRQVQAVADQLGLTRLLERRPADLSGGEQQRVALGRALIRRPKLFLLDEPLSNLDTSLRAEVRDAIRALHATTRTTMLYVTHDQQEALALAQQLAVMREGELLQRGPPAELYDRPAALAVARALGHPPINTVDGEVHVDADGAHLQAAGGRLPLPHVVAAAALPTRVTVAVRPEHLRLHTGDAADGAVLEARVTRLEGAGPERIAWVAWGDADLAMRWPADLPAPPVDSPIHLRVDVRLAHIFDAQTGRLVPVGGGSG